MVNVRIVERTPKTDVHALPEALHPVLKRIYVHRGIKHAHELQRDLGHLLPPARMPGIAQAVERLVVAIRQSQRILIVGDYDCDGATSTALAVLALREMGAAHVDYLIPGRFRFGYGLTPALVDAAAQYAPDLIITVDNGISSIQGVARAQALGISVVITDHHLPGEQLPAADAIVNPNLPGQGTFAGSTAGVGVVFYLLLALRAALRGQGWFASRPQPNMARYLDLVALGTVADVVPLEHNNRILVWQGLQRIRRRHCRPGILALLELAGRMPEQASSTDLGFYIGPRINAAGRLEDMSVGVECLLAENAHQAFALAQRLDEYNRQRRTIEDKMREQAEAWLAEQAPDTKELPWGLCLYDAQWHQGMVGILASRLKDRYHRPVIAFADGEEGELKGSARAIPGLHMRDVLVAIDAREPKLINRFGGHAMAAGLSIPAAQLARFQACFDAVVREQLTAEDLQAVLYSDGELDEADMSLALAEQLVDAGPWGQGFPEPLFHGDFIVREQRLLKEKHWKLKLMPKGGQQPIDAIAFNAATHFPDAVPEHVRIVYALEVNEYRASRQVQLRIRHLEAG